MSSCKLYHIIIDINIHDRLLGAKRIASTLGRVTKQLNWLSNDINKTGNKFIVKDSHNSFFFLLNKSAFTIWTPYYSYYWRAVFWTRPRYRWVKIIIVTLWREFLLWFFHWKDAMLWMNSLMNSWGGDQLNILTSC